MSGAEEGPRPEVRPSRPIVSYALLGLIGAVFVYLIGFDPGQVERLALHGPSIARGEWWRLFTAAVTHLHPLHAFVNASVLYQLGFALEEAMSSWRFAVLSLVGALGSSAFGILLAFEQPAIGASGMGLAWIGAMLFILTPAGRRSMVPSLVLIAALSFVPGIAWQAHLGGFLFGLPLGYSLRVRGGRLFLPVAIGCAALAILIAAFAVSNGGLGV